MEKLIVGFTGKIGVGKTTTCLHLANLLNSNGYSTGLASFGDGLRFAMSREFRLHPSIMFDQQLKNKELGVLPGSEHLMKLVKNCPATAHLTETNTLRNLMQEYSQNGQRKENPDIWVDYLNERVNFMPNDIILVDDIRQKNELDYCRSNGIVFRIPPYKGYQFPEKANHAVESAIDDETEGINTIKELEFGEQNLINIAAKIADFLILFCKESEFDAVFQRMGFTTLS